MFARPEDHMKYLHIREGMSVADIGCGTGAYTFLSARRVGPSGTVYAIDVQEPLLSAIASRAKNEGINTIRVMRADAEHFGGTRLADVSVDAVILANALFQSEQKKDLAVEIKRILVSGGFLMIVDWRDSYGGLGPAPDAVVTEREAIRLFSLAGFVPEQSFDAGDHHYGLIFIKQ